MIRRASQFFAALSLVACQPGSGSRDTTAISAADPAGEAYHGIGEHETVHFTGTEPFWGGEVSGASLTYTTPEHLDGIAIPVERFAGRGGLAFSGSLDGAGFEMTVTPLECGDGMSERIYPFTVTLKLGEDLRNGCGWTGRQPYKEPAAP